MAIEKSDGLLAKHSLLIEIIRTTWATKLDHKIAAEILERYMAKHGNARVSLRYLEQATGATRSNIIASLVRLTTGGAFTVIREGKGTRPTEYGPNFNFSCGIADNTSCGIAGDTSSSGITGDTSSGFAGDTSGHHSGTAGNTESRLLVPLTSGDKLDKSAPGPGASALRQAPARADFEVDKSVVELTVTKAELCEDEGETFIWIEMKDGQGKDREDSFTVQSNSQRAQDAGQADLQKFLRAADVDMPEDVAGLVGLKLQAMGIYGTPEYIPADEWGRRAMGLAA